MSHEGVLHALRYASAVFAIFLVAVAALSIAVLVPVGSLLDQLRTVLWFARWRLDRLVYRLGNGWRDPSDHHMHTRGRPRE
jgi:hypothetical protein